MIEVNSDAGSQHDIELANRQTTVRLLMLPDADGLPPLRPAALSIREGDVLRKFIRDTALTPGAEEGDDPTFPEGWEDAAPINELAFTTKLRYALRVCVMA